MSDFRQWLKQPRLAVCVAALKGARAAFEYSRKGWVVALALLATAVAAGGAAAEPGVGEDKILFGQSAAFQGPAAALGVGVREGILAAFHEANASGGVHGRRLELIARDDGYEPTRAIDNIKKLIHEGQSIGRITFRIDHF